MPSYLYYVQDRQGREIVSAHVDVQKVSDVSAYLLHSEASDDLIAVLAVDDLELASRSTNGEADVTLYRVPSNDKLATPVAHPVRLPEVDS
jgi:hypothetical protein